MAAATAAASDVPPPRTVNGEVLGSAEDFATSGPARICFASLAIDLEQNERAYLEYSGIHSSQMRIIAGKEYFEISMGNALVPEKGSMRVRSDENMRIYGSGNEKEDWYLIYQRTEWTDGEWAYVGQISGTRIKSDAQDDRFLRRLSYAADDDRCTTRYNYGWDTILDGAPIMTKESQ